MSRPIEVVYEFDPDSGQPLGYRFPPGTPEAVQRFLLPRVHFVMRLAGNLVRRGGRR